MFSLLPVKKSSFCSCYKMDDFFSFLNISKANTIYFADFFPAWIWRFTGVIVWVRPSTVTSSCHWEVWSREGSMSSSSAHTLSLSYTKGNKLYLFLLLFNILKTKLLLVYLIILRKFIDLEVYFTNIKLSCNPCWLMPLVIHLWRDLCHKNMWK